MSTIVSLILAGILLLLVEIAMPGGVLGILGIFCILGAIVNGFTISITLGIGLLIAVMILCIIGFLTWVKYFPSTKIGEERMDMMSDE